MLKLIAAFAVVAVMAAGAQGATAGQSRLDPAKAEASRRYPQIVLYSVSWCPHCREAKEYLTRNNIPFINRDVEQDDKAMAELTGKYASTGVPVIVIGSGKGEIVLKGFSAETLQESLKKAGTRP